MEVSSVICSMTKYVSRMTIIGRLQSKIISAIFNMIYNQGV